ncbi:MAG: endo alpha-1,4 polygalactosaminidase [Hyphomicrobiales bacterium]
MPKKPAVFLNVNETEIFFDEQARSLRLTDGAPVTLRAKSFATFLALARHHPTPLNKEGLIEEVWSQTAVSDDSITQCIADIRRALGDKGHALLQTDTGVGYSLKATPRAEGANAEPLPTKRFKFNKMFWGSVGMVGLLMLLTIVIVLRPSANNATDIGKLQATVPAVAALTFDTIGDDPMLTTFAVALRNDIVIALSAFDTVSVLAPSVLDAGTAINETPLQAYTAKGAGYVIGGTIQSAGSGQRVSAHLVDTATNQIVWVRRWESEQGDLLPLQDEIVTTLATNLANPWSGKITGLGAELSSEDPSVDLGANDYARFGDSLFQEYHSKALTEAKQHFRMALKLDAQNAEAWAGLSFVLGALLPMAKPDDVKGLLEARANSGRQAYHIDESTGRSLLAGSWTAAFEGNKLEKLRRLNTAVTKLDGDTDALAIASLQGALTTELYSDAAKWGEQAILLNAQAPPWYFLGPGVAYFFQGDLERAKVNLNRAPQNLPTTMVFLAAAYALSGDAEQATATLARLQMLHNDFSVEHYLAAELLYPKSKTASLRNAISGNSLSSIRNWMYQIQKLNEDGAVQTLAATDYDMLVIEPGQNFSESPYESQQMVSRLREKPDGTPRVVIAYIDIGQAEDYRTYWQDDWVAPKDGLRGSPGFLVAADPNGWEGNYPVAYWDAEWQSLWLGPDGIVADLARLGYDGVFLDWIEAYDDDGVRAVAEKFGVSPEDAMITFVEKLGEAGRAINPDFLIIAQNAIYLIDSAPDRYAKAIDALAVESTWFNGLGDSDWGDPDSGDLHDQHVAEYSTPARLTQILRYQNAGLPVFSVDYALKQDNIAKVYSEAQSLEMIPLVTRVSLSKLTETPPQNLEPD